jgi:hypothetical protein
MFLVGKRRGDGRSEAAPRGVAEDAAEAEAAGAAGGGGGSEAASLARVSPRHARTTPPRSPYGAWWLVGERVDGGRAGERVGLVSWEEGRMEGVFARCA